MIVLTEKTSIISKSIMFWILVFSCPKMTLITIFTRMTQGKVEKERGAINGQGQGEDGGGQGVGEGEEKDAPLQLCLNSD